ncbi:MAG TPA: cytochrome c3 family protein [Gammaproteobacteria bacterium]|nr:cytochrome c3 family protein [Gammaproteobacteria bacterium]
MKKHVLRPLWVAIGLVAVVLIAREFMVPPDFGVHGETFTYHYYRLSNVEEWKNFPAKYQGQERCARCHKDNAAEHSSSKHATIQCENCHGPGVDHPRQVKKLVIDTSREQCLRCHQYLPYPTSQRMALPAIDNQEHWPERECHVCHNPHYPDRRSRR